MPDLIPGKGEATCRMAVFNFTMLEAAGVHTHFRRFIAPNRIEFALARVLDPDAGPLTPDAGNYLIPVQVLFRNELPQGSSVHRRLASGALTPADVGLHGIPAVGETLRHPLIEYATTREDVNRFIGGPEAQRLASPGTPDESRLMFNGVHCGKQVIRNWYVDNGLEVPVSRLIAGDVPRSRWPRPAPLPPEFLPVMSDLYRSLSETWTGESLWDAPDLQTATRAVARLISQ